MYSEKLSDILVHVITSWQVIVVTVALVLYLFIVFYVAKAYRRPRVKAVRIRLRKSKPEAAAGPEEIDDSDGGDVNDELGLEEE